MNALPRSTFGTTSLFYCSLEFITLPILAVNKHFWHLLTDKFFLLVEHHLKESPPLFFLQPAHFPRPSFFFHKKKKVSYLHATVFLGLWISCCHENIIRPSFNMPPSMQSFKIAQFPSLTTNKGFGMKWQKKPNSKLHIYLRFWHLYTQVSPQTEIPKPTHFLYRRMAMTMQIMKTTARTGPNTHMRPSPASTGKGSTTSSGVTTVSVYGLAANIFWTETIFCKN